MSKALGILAAGALVIYLISQQKNKGVIPIMDNTDPIDPVIIDNGNPDSTPDILTGGQDIYKDDGTGTLVYHHTEVWNEDNTIDIYIMENGQYVYQGTKTPRQNPPVNISGVNRNGSLCPPMCDTKIRRFPLV